MRPAGEVRQALFQACQALATPDQGPTLQELAAKACVGLDAARRTVSNMQRAKLLHTPRTRRVNYRNRPVAEYAPVVAEVPQDDGYVDLSAVLRVWGG
jgi:hypothetical protein